jgi:hypothetical protein
MESPSLIDVKFYSRDKEALHDVMAILISLGKSFSYYPRGLAVRMLIRSRDRLRGIENEVKGREIPVKIIKKFL